MIEIPREICLKLDDALTHEWLVTNGLGSYASSTISCTRTRRYHGLLIGALDPPLGRTLLLAKLDEECEVNGQTYQLGSDEYGDGVVQPNGYLFLRRVRLQGMFPVLEFETANFKLTKTIWMEYGRDTTFVRYELDPFSSPINLTLLPLCTYRDFHSETHGNLQLSPGVQRLDRGLQVSAFQGGRPFRVLGVPALTFTQLGIWYWHFRLRVEQERGLGHDEDLFLPGLLRARLEPGKSLTIVATLEPDDSLDLNIEEAWTRAGTRQQALINGAHDEFEAQLFLAADQFLVARPGARISEGDKSTPASTVIAGYHWFGDWGRDTMIALEGLTLTTGRFQLAHDIILTFSRFVSQGMLPNRFPDTGQTPEYNTADATLWYFHAIDRYVTVTHDRELLRTLFPTLREIIDWHIRGTRYHIHVDPADGLLYSGESGVQLTWMDAKVDDWVVTPRTGKPVEINALWYNALRLMETWSDEFGHPDPVYTRLANQAAASFDRYRFAPGGYLYDVIDGPDGPDSSMRPNQVLALSLRYSAVPASFGRSILELIQKELLTPYGLRTLSPYHKNYQGRFTGDRKTRDTAYHNGTVWAWLLGPFLDAHRRLNPEYKDRIEYLSAFDAHLRAAGLGTISECFEGDAPHRPVGCIAQAWSVAEILRSYRIAWEESRRTQ